MPFTSASVSESLNSRLSERSRRSYLNKNFTRISASRGSIGVSGGQAQQAALGEDTNPRSPADSDDFGNSFAAAVTRDSIEVPRFSLYDTIERLLINDSRTLSMLEIKQVDTFNLLTEAAARALRVQLRASRHTFTISPRRTHCAPS